MVGYAGVPDGNADVTFAENGDIVITAKRLDHSEYWSAISGHSLAAYTPSVWADMKQAVSGRYEESLGQWRSGGLGYVAAPISFLLSPLTGSLDLGSSYYRGRHGWIAPADRETTDIALIGIGGVETIISKMGRLGSIKASGGIEAAYERGVAIVDRRLAAGDIVAPAGQPAHLFRAGQIDDFARRDLRAFALDQGHGTDLVRINQRLYLEGNSGKYRIPDLYFPQSQTIFDGTLGTKTLSTPQIIDFRTATGDAPIGIVRPQSYGGFYWLGN